MNVKRNINVNSRGVQRLFVLATACLVAVPHTAMSDTCTNWQAALSEWESEMVTYGIKWGEFLDPASGNSFGERLGAQYYDGQWVFQQIGAYLNAENPWNEYAQNAQDVYLDEYLVPANFQAQGFRRFPHGLFFAMQPAGSVTPQVIENMRDKPAFSVVAGYIDPYDGKRESLSREVAYALQANILAERAGFNRVFENGVSRVESFVRWTEGYFYQWKSGDFTNKGTTTAISTSRFAPFMAGLSLHALIEWVEWEEENGRDPNDFWSGQDWESIDTMMIDFLLWMRDESTIRQGGLTGTPMWYLSADGDGALRYQDRGEGDDTKVAYALGNLLAFQYAWAANRIASGKVDGTEVQARRLIETADLLFTGTANNAWVEGNGKFFNQSYRLGFRYLETRNMLPGSLTSCGPRPNPPILISSQ